MSFVSIVWQKIAQYSTNSKYCPFFCSLFPLCLSFIINGRFALGILGLSLIIYKLYYRKYEDSGNDSYITDFIGLFLATVSSGTFSFGVSLFLIDNFKQIIKSYFYNLYLLSKLKFRKKGPLKSIFEIIFIFLIFLLFLMFTIKNFNYYGGFNLNGFKGLLSHGIGIVFSQGNLLNQCLSSKSELCEFIYIFNSNIPILILTLISISILVFIAFQLFINKNLNHYCKLTIIFSVISGLFGITAFLSLILIIPQLRIRPFTTAKLK